MSDERHGGATCAPSAALRELASATDELNARGEPATEDRGDRADELVLGGFVERHVLRQDVLVDLPQPVREQRALGVAHAVDEARHLAPRAVVVAVVVVI